jgi:hypothetical protein
MNEVAALEYLLLRTALRGAHLIDIPNQLTIGGAGIGLRAIRFVRYAPQARITE